MRYRFFSPLAAAVASLLPAVASGGYEAPDPAYGPGNYYSSVNFQNTTTLKTQLTTRLNSGFRSQSYNSIRSRFGQLDADPANPGKILLIYNRASVSAMWDAGSTYNREHIWPDSRLPNSAADSDYFNLRPSNPSINSRRGNDPFSGVFGGGGYGDRPGGTWYPGDADAGDVARSLFYMATKYAGEGVSLVNGTQVSGNQMGDLQSLLQWHYADGVDNFERRRNDVIQDYQANRNPYVDHPELVWAVFGGGSNNSRLTASSTKVSLGPVIQGAPLGTAQVSINKTGANPTTYDLITSGQAVTPAAGAGQAFGYNAQSRLLNVGLAGSTAVPGLKSGTIRLDNTDLTSAGAGMGSADPDEIITVSAAVLAPSNASFASIDQDTLAYDLGVFAPGTSHQVTLDGIIRNLESFSGYTAALDLDRIVAAGGQADAIRLEAGFTSLLAGESGDLLAAIDAPDLGTFTATYQLLLSDEDLPGAGAFGSQALSLTLTATVVPEPTALGLALPALLLCRRRR